MEIIAHQISENLIAEIISDQVLISNSEEGLELMANIYYQGFETMILNRKNFSIEFFDLKNGLAGEILQKFSNYRMKLIIVGDFSNLTSQSLIDFIFESNNGQMVNFVKSIDEALMRLTK